MYITQVLSQAARRRGKGLLTRPRAKRPEDYGDLIKDPAIERWNSMRETTTYNFKWTPRTSSELFLWVIVVPGTLYYTLKNMVESQQEEAGYKHPHWPDDIINPRRPDPLPEK